MRKVTDPALLAELESPSPSSPENRLDNPDFYWNSARRGLANLGDAYVGLPQNLLSIVQMLEHYPSQVLGIGEKKPLPQITLSQPINRAAEKVGLIDPALAPKTPGERIVDFGVQAATGGFLSPGNMFRNAGVAGLSGLAGGTVQEISDSPLAGFAASMLTPFAVQGARHAIAGSNSKIGRVLETAAAQSPDDLAEAIRRGNKTLVADAPPTTTQAVRNPGISQLERSVRNVGYNPLVYNDDIQNAARLRALDSIDGVGPLALTSNEAAENAGALLRDRYTGIRNATKAAERGKFNDPSLNALEFDLPGGGIKAAIEQYFPGMNYPKAPLTLRELVDAADSGWPVSHAELQTQRSLIGELERDLFNTGARGRAAALAVKNELSSVYDRAVEAGKHKLQVTGEGPFGPVYGNLAGDPENAVAHLLRTGAGEVPKAGTNPMAGDVSLVAGYPVKKGQGSYGLLHIDAQGREDVLNRLPGLLTEGTPYSRLQVSKKGLQPKDGETLRYYLGDGDYEALIRKDFDNLPVDDWNHTAYAVDPDKKLPIGTTQSSRASDFTPSTQTPTATAGSQKNGGSAAPAENIPRNPRAYKNLMTEEQAHLLNEARALHRWRKENLESGPAFGLTQMGRDGVPLLQGAEIPKAFFNSKASQAADIAQFDRAFQGDQDAYQALRNYALSDLKQAATRSNGLLSDATLQKWMNSRSGALKGLLTGEQADALNAVAADLHRAEDAAGLGQARGSNTTQNLLNAGLLESPLVSLLFNKLPLISQITSPVLTALREASRRQLAGQIGDALLNPDIALQALAAQSQLQALSPIRRGLLTNLAIESANRPSP
jgi:hypothetical protein